MKPYTDTGLVRATLREIRRSNSDAYRTLREALATAYAQGFNDGYIAGGDDTYRSLLDTGDPS